MENGKGLNQNAVGETEVDRTLGEVSSTTEKIGNEPFELAAEKPAKGDKTPKGSAPQAGKKDKAKDKTSKKEKNNSKNKKSGKGGNGGKDEEVADAVPERVPSSKYNYYITNKEVKKHNRKRLIALILMIFLLGTIILGAVVYGISSMIQYNNLKILVNKSGANVFSLSSTAQFEVGSEVLALGGPRFMDNISLMDFYNQVPEIKKTEGAYMPADVKFLAATFYLKNLTNKRQNYTEAVALDEVTNNLDEAMRVMLIKGDVQTVYAKAKPKVPGESCYGDVENLIMEEVCPGQLYGEGGKFVEKPSDVWMTQPFINPRYAFYNTGNVLEPQQVVAYTVIVWLEGWDKECVDARLGGTVRMELQFTQA